MASSLNVPPGAPQPEQRSAGKQRGHVCDIAAMCAEELQGHTGVGDQACLQQRLHLGARTGLCCFHAIQSAALGDRGRCGICGSCGCREACCHGTCVFLEGFCGDFAAGTVAGIRNCRACIY